MNNTDVYAEGNSCREKMPHSLPEISDEEWKRSL